MICKHCGKETTNVICDNCGINVVWYNKYGIQNDIENPSEAEQYQQFITNNDNREEDNND